MPGSFEKDKLYKRQGALQIGKRSVSFATRSREDDERCKKTIFFPPGIISGKTTSSLLDYEFYGCGYDTVSMAHDKVDDYCSEDVMAMIDAIKEGKIVGDGSEELYVFPHSLGVIHAVLAMYARPDIRDYVDGMVFMAPTGHGGTHPKRMFSSLASEVIHRPVNDYARKVMLDAIEYTIRAGPHLIKKIIQARDVRVIDETRALIEERGVPITALLFIHDQLVKHAEVSEGLGRAGVEYAFDVVAQLAGHNALLQVPKIVAARGIDAINSIEDGLYLERGATRLIGKSAA